MLAKVGVAVNGVVLTKPDASCAVVNLACCTPRLLVPVVDLTWINDEVVVQVVVGYLNSSDPIVIKEFVAEFASIEKDLKLVVSGATFCITTFPEPSTPKAAALAVVGVVLLILVNFNPDVPVVPEAISTLAVGVAVPIPILAVRFAILLLRLLPKIAFPIFIWLFAAAVKKVEEFPIKIFPLPEVKATPPAPPAGFPVLSPIAVFEFPVVRVPNASVPTATLKVAPVITSSELYPTATLSPPPLLVLRAPLPIAVILEPVVLFCSD